MKFSLSNPLLKQIPTTDIMDAKIESSDFDQWLQAMKMVARLPGGMPPEFRRKVNLCIAVYFNKDTQIYINYKS